MNKKILFILALSWILVGCERQAPLLVGTPVDDRTVSISGCEPYKGPKVECPAGDEKDQKATIYLDTLDVEPECITAKKGKKIEFMLESTGELEKGSVVIFPQKVGNFPWLIASNSQTKNKITIHVPTEKESGAPFPAGEVKYGILTAAKCVDPRINVVN